MSIIMEPINTFFGAILNIIFEGVVAISPVATLGISIIIFTLVTRILLTPLQLSSQRTSRGMSKIQPEMQRLQNKYKNKKDQQSQMEYSNEMKVIYKKYKINPLAGCLPLLIQFPIIIALFSVLREPAKHISILGDKYREIASTISNHIPNYEGMLEGFKQTVETTSRVQYDITQNEGLGNFLSHLNSNQWQEILNQVNTDVKPLLEKVLTDKEQFEVFLGVNLIDTPALLIKGGMWLALLVPLIAGISTFIFSKITMANSAAMQQTSADGTKQANPAESMMKTMNIMMPVMTAMFSYTMPIGLAVYWISGNIIMMGQQWIVNKMVVKQEEKLDEMIKRERELEAQTKKVIKKKVIKKVPVQNQGNKE